MLQKTTLQLKVTPEIAKEAVELQADISEAFKGSFYPLETTLASRSL